jgi:segregation and condensation protein A
VTEKYLEFLSLMTELRIDIASEYLVMAATLVYLKSRELLPPDPHAPPDIDDETGEQMDPREALIKRLLEYQKYKDAAAKLDAFPIMGRDAFVRPSVDDAGASNEQAPLAEVPVIRLVEALSRIMLKAKGRISHEVTTDRISITERILELCDQLARHPRIEFSQLFEHASTRFDFVITFLALLEMARLRMTKIEQSEPYSPLIIEFCVVNAEELAAAKKKLPSI